MDPYRVDDPGGVVPCEICGEVTLQVAVQFTPGGARACPECAARANVRKAQPPQPHDFFGGPLPNPLLGPVSSPQPHGEPDALAAPPRSRHPVLAFARGFVVSAFVYFFLAMWILRYVSKDAGRFVAEALVVTFILIYTSRGSGEGITREYRMGMLAFGALLAVSCLLRWLFL